MPADRFAVIGDPVAHSLSPRMQTAALEAAGLAGVYEPLHVTPDDLGDAVLRLRRAHYRGFNVTIPHKRAIVPLLDRLDTSAREIGAVNTVVREDGELIGYNTDSEGFDRALTALAGAGWRGHCLIFGAGGAARAVIVALVMRGCGITVTNRTLEAIDALAADLGSQVAVARRLEERIAAVAAADLLVNATPLGMGDLADQSALPAGARFHPGALAIDLVYGRVTPFMRTAREGGCRVQDGSEMLVQQGAAAFRLWTGVQPDLNAMRAAGGARLTEVVP